MTNCDIYQALSNADIYLFVPSGITIDNLPEKVFKKIGALQYFKSISITPDSPLIGADASQVISDLESKGYHLVGAKVETSVSEAGAALGGGILAASLGLGPIGALAGAAIGLFVAHSSKGDGS